MEETQIIITAWDTRVSLSHLSHDMISVLSMAANNQQQHKQQSPSDWLFVTLPPCGCKQMTVTTYTKLCMCTTATEPCFPLSRCHFGSFGDNFFLQTKQSMIEESPNQFKKKNHKNKDDI